MRDLRLLAPAGFAWLAAWCAIGLPGGHAAAAVAAWGLWGLAGIAAVVAVAGPLRERGRQAPAVHAVAGGAVADAAAVGGAADARGAGRPIVRAAATLLVVLSAGALATSAAAIGLGAREDSRLAAAATAHRTAEVVIDLTGAPRALALERGGAVAACGTHYLLGYARS